MAAAGVTRDIVERHNTVTRADAITRCRGGKRLGLAEIARPFHQICKAAHVDLNALPRIGTFLDAMRGWHDVDPRFHESDADADGTGIVIVRVTDKIIPANFREKITLAEIVRMRRVAARIILIESVEVNAHGSSH